mmetsp:Transcript_3179/g.3526  ORF Transcript_3179/g.3526 Transcript_3179/m.3526 type:complete len:82 (+) Transcript_3179:141-386(+)
MGSAKEAPKLGPCLPMPTSLHKQRYSPRSTPAPTACIQRDDDDYPQQQQQQVGLLEVEAVENYMARPRAETKQCLLSEQAR